jgi:hypothetical protein
VVDAPHAPILLAALDHAKREGAAVEPISL